VALAVVGITSAAISLVSLLWIYTIQAMEERNSKKLRILAEGAE